MIFAKNKVKSSLAIAGISLLISMNGYAAESPSIDLDLEEKVWTASNSMLTSLESQVTKVIQTNPRDPYSSYLLSIYYMNIYKQNQGGLDALRKASSLARQAIDLDPNGSLGYLALSNIALDIGQADKALSLIDQMDKAATTSGWRKDLIKSKIYIHVGSKADKIEQFSLLLGKNKAPISLFSYFAYGMLETLKPEEAIGAASAWYTTYKDRNINFLLGRSYQRAGKNKEAHKHYSRAIKKGLSNLDLYVEDGLLLLNHLDRPKEALKLFEKAITSAKESMDYESTILADIHLHKGFAHLVLNQTDEAIEDHIKSIDAYSAKQKLLQHMAKKYRTMGRSKVLADLLTKTAEEVPGLSYSHALLGEVLSDDIKAPNRALKAYADAITLSPESSEYYNGMGLAYYKLKRFKSAVDVFTIASELNPEDATSRYNIACMLAILGRQDEALTNLKGALSLDPSLIGSAVDDDDFQNIKHHPSFKALTTEVIAH